jgi:7-cyano-7-deazaguanine synthase in queuosine biosynthesis
MNKEEGTKIMAVSEITTFEIQRQLLDRRVISEEVNVPLETDSSLQTSEGDVVTLNVAEQQNFSGSYVDVQSTYEQTVQDISSVAQAASKYSQTIEGDLNEDELNAIKKLSANIEPIVNDFLSSSPDGLDVEKAIAVLTGNQEIAKEVAVELTNAVMKTLGLESSEVSLGSRVSAGTTSEEVEAPDLNVENIQKFYELATSTVDAELHKQFQVLNTSSKELIINSMNDLMRFFQDKVSQVLEPLKYPVSLDTGEIDLVDAKTQA